MNYVTKELKYNKNLRKILKKNVSFKEKEFSLNLKDRYENSNPAIIGNAYELLFQIEYLIYEKNIYEFYNLKFSRTKKLLSNKDIGTEVLKAIFKHEKNIIRYMSGEKVKGLYTSILYLTKVCSIRDIKDISGFKEITSKDDRNELKNLHNRLNKKIFKKLKIRDFNFVLQSGYLLGEIDILTEDMILDIKTTTFPVITEDMIYQQIIYKIMLEKDIKYIAIFLSKYNKLVKFKYKKLVKNEKNIKKFLNDKFRINSF